MQIDILSLFPEMFDGPLNTSIIGKARAKGILNIDITNPRDFANNKHGQVDDTPYGGGAGMVLKPEPFFRAMDEVTSKIQTPNVRRIILCPTGNIFTQHKALELSRYEHLIFICGHYEGFDNRIVENLADEVISVGDYVLTGGELPAMMMIDAISRMLPDVLGSPDSAITDSFYNGLLEYPQYTKPRIYRGIAVPDVLLSGNHAKIAQWRHEQSLIRTKSQRPDLLDNVELTEDEHRFLSNLE